MAAPLPQPECGETPFTLLDEPPAHLHGTTEKGGPPPGNMTPMSLGTRMPSHCIVECHHNLPLHTTFRIKLLRTMRAHLNIFPGHTTVREARPIIIQRNISHSFVDGWSVVTYYTHDCSKVLLKGENLLKIDHTTHIPLRSSPQVNYRGGM